MDRVVGAKQVLAVVPARGGSKSLPRKNLRPFGGYPLLAWSIAAGLQSEIVGRVIVSTDDEEIARVAKEYGAEVPFLRPLSLAQDDTPDLPVFEHVLDWLSRQEGYVPEIVVQLRPTSPVRPPDLIGRAVRALFEDPQADSVRAVVPSGQNPYKMWKLDGNRLRSLMAEPTEAYNLPRQALPQTYWQTGHIDVVRTGTIIARGSMSGEVILPLILDPGYAVDIDNESDWRRAESLLLELNLPYVRPGRSVRRLPGHIDLLVLDFDGVLTDNRVWVNAAGEESVAANRGDGWGLARLKACGVHVLVLSTETDPVVSARCRKLGLSVEQGIDDKRGALERLLGERGVDPGRVVYVGNDLNDLPCFRQVGFAAAPADAHVRVRAEADLVLSQRGGHGAVREMCDMIIHRITGKGGND